MKTPHLRHIRAAAALLPMLIILSAPGPASAQRTTGMLKGKITDAESGDPIAAVNVIVMDAEGKITPQGAMTNEDGEYVIINVKPGIWGLRVAMMGYEQVHLKDVRVTAAMTVVHDFALVRSKQTTGTIKGRVTNRMSGNGLAAVNVIVAPANQTDTSLQLGALTNDDGDYVIINVPPGRYNVKVLLPGFKAVAIEDVLVTIGVTTIRNFALEAGGASGGVIRGRILDSEKREPMAAVNVILLETDGTATNMGAYTDANGEYRMINVPPGRYNLKVQMAGFKSVIIEDMLVTNDVSTIRNFRLESSK